jgi:hypothetical protein
VSFKNSTLASRCKDIEAKGGFEMCRFVTPNYLQGGTRAAFVVSLDPNKESIMPSVYEPAKGLAEGRRAQVQQLRGVKYMGDRNGDENEYWQKYRCNRLSCPYFYEDASIIESALRRSFCLNECEVRANYE